MDIEKNSFGLSNNGIKSALSSPSVAGLTLQILIGKQTRQKLNLSDGLFSSNSFVLSKPAEAYDERDIERFAIIEIIQAKCFKFQGDNAVLIQQYNMASIEKPDNVLGSPANYKPPCFASGQPHVCLRDLIVETNDVSVLCQVTFKSPMKEYFRDGCKKQYFNVHLQDETGVSRATAFANVQALYDSIQEGSTYLLTNMIPKAEDNVKYALGSVQLNFSTSSEVVERATSVILSNPFNFTSIASIQNMLVDQTLDLIVVIKGLSELTTFCAQGSTKSLTKRELVILDTSANMITLTLWGQDAETFAFKLDDIISIRRARVSNFGGKSLVASNLTEIRLGSHLHEGKLLVAWKRKQPPSYNYTNLTAIAAGVKEEDCEEMLLVEIEDSCESSEPLYVSASIRIKSIESEGAVYMSCNNVKCKKKVVSKDDSFYCQKCFADVANPCPRLMVHMRIEDDSAATAAVAFQSVAETILKQSVTDLMSLKASSEESYNQAFQAVLDSEFNVILKISYKKLEKGKKRTTEIFKLISQEEPKKKKKKH